MEHLYRTKGGTAEQFNCVALRLNPDDIAHLERDILINNLPATTGFFFGNNPPDDDSVLDDLQFIAKAKFEHYKGNSVYYYSWW